MRKKRINCKSSDKINKCSQFLTFKGGMSTHEKPYKKAITTTKGLGLYRKSLHKILRIFTASFLARKNEYNHFRARFWPFLVNNSKSMNRLLAKFFFWRLRVLRFFGTGLGKVTLVNTHFVDRSLPRIFCTDFFTLRNSSSMFLCMQALRFY